MNPTKEPATKRHRAAKKRGGSSKKISNSLVALSSAAVLTVYTAGYLRTQSAAELFAEDRLPRRLAGAVEPASPTEAPAQAVAGGELVAPPEPAVASSPPQLLAPPAVPETVDRPSVARAPSATQETPAAVPAPVPAPAPDDVAPAPLEAAAAPAPPSEAPVAPPDAPAPEPTSAPAPAASVAATAPPSAPPAPRKKKYSNGTYSGWGTSRHGNILATVVVLDGEIISAEIARCETQYSCAILDALPGQVLSRQSAYVDLVSGATESADAFANAIFRALLSAQK